MCKILFTLILIVFKSSHFIHALCIAVDPPTCLTALDEADAKEVLDYVLSKYEETEMKITGQPLGVRGKKITGGGFEEINISFSYVDNTPGDIIQNCVFVVLQKAGECETINVVCNTYLRATPRPLLKREELTVCEDGEERRSGTSKEEEEVQTETVTA